MFSTLWSTAYLFLVLLFENYDVIGPLNQLCSGPRKFSGRPCCRRVWEKNVNVALFDQSLCVIKHKHSIETKLIDMAGEQRSLIQPKVLFLAVVHQSRSPEPAILLVEERTAGLSLS